MGPCFTVRTESNEYVWSGRPRRRCSLGRGSGHLQKNSRILEVTPPCQLGLGVLSPPPGVGDVCLVLLESRLHVLLSSGCSTQTSSRSPRWAGLQESVFGTFQSSVCSCFPPKGVHPLGPKHGARLPAGVCHYSIRVLVVGLAEGQEGETLCFPSGCHSPTLAHRCARPR